MPEVDMKREIRSTVRRPEARQADGAERRIGGYAAVYYDGTPETEFELWPGFRERIHPGAFDAAVRDDDVRALWNHNWDQPLGRTKSGTLRLSVDQTGLLYEVDLPDNEDGKRAWTSVERGDTDGSSFAFDSVEEDESEEDGVWIRNIRAVRLFDVSPVTFPAYVSTTVQARGKILATASAPPVAGMRPVLVRARICEISLDME